MKRSRRPLRHPLSGLFLRAVDSLGTSQATLDGEGGTFDEVQLGRRPKTEEAVEEDAAALPWEQRQEAIRGAE